MRLPDRVTVQAKTTTADGQGGRSTSWGLLSNQPVNGLAASVNALRGNERLQAAAIGSTVAYHVTLRYRADVTPAMRLQWTQFQSTTAKTLEIHTVQPHEGGRRYLVLDCSEVI